MSSQYVQCECEKCLVYSTDKCGTLTVGEPFKKLLPVFSTPSEYTHHYRIPNSKVPSLESTSVFTSTYTPNPLNDQQYVRWVQESAALNGLSYLLDKDKIRLGSPQLTFKVKWSVRGLRGVVCAKEDRFVVVVPVRGTELAHEPWDIKGNKIDIPVPQREGETTKGCFTIPGQYWRFLLYGPSLLASTSVELRVIGYVNTPDIYGVPPSMYYVHTCCGKLLAYTNTIDNKQVVTRTASPVLATLSRIVQDVYTSKTYFGADDVSDGGIFIPPVPIDDSTVIVTFESTYQCSGAGCASLNNVPFNEGNVLGVGEISNDPNPLFYTGPEQSYPWCGLVHAIPAISKVDYTTASSKTFVSATVGGVEFKLTAGVSYRVRVKLGPDETPTSYGRGVSWLSASEYNNGSQQYDDRRGTFGLQKCGAESFFGLALFDGKSAVPYEKVYSRPAVTPGFQDNGKIDIGLLWYDNKVYTPTGAPGFYSPIIPEVISDNPFDNRYSYVFTCTSSNDEYYYTLGSCITILSIIENEVEKRAYSPLCDFKFEVEITAVK